MKPRSRLGPTFFTRRLKTNIYQLPFLHEMNLNNAKEVGRSFIDCCELRLFSTTSNVRDVILLLSFRCLSCTIWFRSYVIMWYHCQKNDCFVAVIVVVDVVVNVIGFDVYVYLVV